MYDIKPTRHVRTCKCGKLAITTGICGPTNICDDCTDALLAIIWGPAWPAMRDHTRSHGREVPTGGKKRRPGRLTSAVLAGAYE